jgi:hypothetical protein
MAARYATQRARKAMPYDCLSVRRREPVPLTVTLRENEVSGEAGTSEVQKFLSSGRLASSLYRQSPIKTNGAQ